MLTQRASTARAPARARHSALSPSQQSRRTLQSRLPVSVAASYHLLADLGVASSADAMQAMMPVLCVSTALGGFLLARSNSSTEAVIAQTPDKVSTESTEAADNAAEARSWIARWRESVKAKTKTQATPAPKDTPMPSPATNEARILGAKAQLLRYCEDVARGRTATAEDAAAIEELASALESINPNPRPLENPDRMCKPLPFRSRRTPRRSRCNRHHKSAGNNHFVGPVDRKTGGPSHCVAESRVCTYLRTTQG